jgi:predicted alpha/beta-fold hydrolase
LTGPDDFQPSVFLPGGHLQTIGGHVVRSFLRWPYSSEDVVVESTDGARLLLRASWQAERDRPALLLVHGLEGSDRAPYVLATGILAYRAGWHVVRMNMRGCGDSLAVCPRLYNAALTSDLLATMHWLAGRVSRFALVAFSLGANLSLLTASREKPRLPREFAALATVSPPLDMSRSADELERPSNFIYQLRFVLSLQSSYRRRQRLSPERYAPGRERGLKTLRAFDDVITAHYGGYRDAEHYYQSASAGPRLKDIELPTLVLASRNDPFIPVESISHWERSSAVVLELTPSGGHVGFVGAKGPPRRFWAAHRVVSWLANLNPK